MPKLQVYERQVQPETPSINISAAAQAMTPSAQIGRSISEAGREFGNIQAQVGNMISSQGQEYVDKANAALEDGQYNSIFAKASVEFNTRVAARMRQSTDEQGRPNFDQIGTDVNNIADEVYNKYGQEIYNPNVSARFQSSFGQLRMNKDLQAAQTGREQQTQFSIAALNEGINADMTNATLDQPSMAPQYEAQAVAKINDALRNGLIDPVQAQEQRQRIRSTIYMNVAKVQNSQDPYAIKSRLDKGDNLGLDPIDLIKMKDFNESAIRDQESKLHAQEVQKAKIIKDSQTYNKKELDLALQSGQAGELDIKDAYDKQAIDHDGYYDLMKSMMVARGQNIKTSQTRLAITDAIKLGTNLSNFSNAEINDSYTNQVGMLQQGNAPVDINTKARVAGQYAAPVSDFTNELRSIVLSGRDNNSVVQAVQAYQFANQQNPLSVSSLDDKTRSFLSLVSSQIKYSGADPTQTIINARKQVLDADDNVYKMRVDGFRNIKTFQDSNIRSTVADMYDTKWFSTDSVDDELLPIVKNLLKTAYSFTGDENAAMQMVKDQTRGIIGTSSMNQDEGHDVVMYAPPEKAYANLFTPAELRMDLNKAVEGQLPAGVDASRVNVQSDAQTVNEQDRPSYSLYYRNGRDKVWLTSKETGLPLRWVPDVQGKAADKLNTLNQLRGEQFAREQDFAKTVEGITTIDARKALKDLGITAPQVKEGTLKNTELDIDMSNPNVIALDKDKVFADPIPVRNTPTSLGNMMEAIASIESSGNYNARGVPLGGDQALGKYQIMRSNLGAWSLEALGRPVSEYEFMNSPELQDKIASFQMNKMLNTYGTVADVVSVWHSGVPVAKAANRVDRGTGLRTLDYVAKAMKNYRKLGGEK